MAIPIYVIGSPNHEHPSGVALIGVDAKDIMEIGFTGRPFSTEGIFHRDSSIEAYNKDLFKYYQKLIRLRNKYSALKDTTFRTLSTESDGPIVAFHRWKNGENFILAVNAKICN